MSCAGKIPCGSEPFLRLLLQCNGLRLHVICFFVIWLSDTVYGSVRQSIFLNCKKLALRGGMRKFGSMRSKSDGLFFENRMNV